MRLRRALEGGECASASVPEEVVEFLATRAGGYARTALAALELACEDAGEGAVDLELAEQALQRKALRYDKGGDQHYDSPRGSRPRGRPIPTPRCTTWR